MSQINKIFYKHLPYLIINASVYIYLCLITIICICPINIYATKNISLEDNKGRKTFVKADLNSKDNIKIAADHLSIDKIKKSATYSGNVIIRFDDIIINTQKLIITYANTEGQGKINNISMPYKLKAIRTISNEIVIADRGEYVAAENKLKLLGNIHYTKDKNFYKMNEFTYILNKSQ